jgi:hypothetical protein
MYYAACYKTALTPITPQDIGHADGQGVGITTGTTKTVEGPPNQRERLEFALSGHDANANYNDALLYQSHQATLGTPVSMSQALLHICSTPLALTAHLPWDWRLPPNNVLPFEQIARGDLGHLAFLARGGLWEFHLSVLVTAAPGCYNLPHPSYFTKHGSKTHLGLVKESAYVTRTFLRSLNHTLALSLWTKEGVERFLAAVRNANPWFYDFHHGLYVQRLRGVPGLRIPHRYLA